MPKRNDIHKIMIIGSGPIIIGQACKALKSLGYEIVLVNANPATIITDPGMADITYLEPLNVETMEKIIAKERPDALLPNLGGQSGLNLSSELTKRGVLERYDVKIIGVAVDAIERGEDRIEFKTTMERLGIEMPKSAPAYSVEEAERIAQELGYPVVIRPAYTMGETGGGLVYNVEELRTVASRGLSASLIGQILVEESVLGWEELELENGEIQLVINTPSGKLSKYDDSYIRKSAIKYKIPYITTLAAAMAAVRGIEAYQNDHGFVKSLQGYHKDIDTASAEAGGSSR